MLRQCTEPLFEGLFGVDDDFQFSVLQSAHDTWDFRRERDLDPFPVEPERVGDLENAADLLERHHLEGHRGSC